MPFNTVISNLSSYVGYNTVTREFTVDGTGNYFVSWWINTDGAGAEPTVLFNLETSAGNIFSSSSPAPIVSLQLNGTALLAVHTAPITVSLVNRSNAAVNYGSGAVQANIVFLHLEV